jgi:hypothetical protein
MPSVHRVIASGLLIFASVVPAFAQTRLASRADSLRGIRVIRVVVEDMPGLEDRLPVSDLQSSIELELQKEGIRIATPDESALYPILMLRSSIVDVEQPASFVYNLDLKLFKVLDMPMVDREGPEPIRANTWDASTTGIVGSARVSGTLRNTVDDLMHDFMSDYRTVNER